MIIRNFNSLDLVGNWYGENLVIFFDLEARKEKKKRTYSSRVEHLCSTTLSQLPYRGMVMTEENL